MRTDGYGGCPRPLPGQLGHPGFSGGLPKQEEQKGEWGPEWAHLAGAPEGGCQFIRGQAGERT